MDVKVYSHRERTLDSSLVWNGNHFVKFMKACDTYHCYVPLHAKYLPLLHVIRIKIHAFEWRAHSYVVRRNYAIFVFLSLIVFKRRSHLRPTTLTLVVPGH